MFQLRGAPHKPIGAGFGCFCPCDGVGGVEFQTIHVVAKPFHLGPPIATGFQGLTFADLRSHACFFGQLETGLEGSAFTFEFIHPVLRLLQALAVPGVDDQGTSAVNLEGILTDHLLRGRHLGGDSLQARVEAKKVLKSSCKGRLAGF
jgi:hypothetical protein